VHEAHADGTLIRSVDPGRAAADQGAGPGARTADGKIL
jgi:hypothetical protein